MSQLFRVFGMKPLNRLQLVWAALRGEIFPVDEPRLIVRPSLVEGGPAALLDIASRGGWSVGSALRGPDGPYPWDRLKRVFTERIRGVALGLDANGIPTRTAHSYPVRSSRLSPQEAEGFLSAMRTINIPENVVTLQHFLVHIRDAAQALELHDLAELASSYLPELSAKGSRQLRMPELTVEQVIALAGGAP